MLPLPSQGALLNNSFDYGMKHPTLNVSMNKQTDKRLS